MKVRSALPIIAIFALFGCQQEVPEKSEVIRPVKLALVEQASGLINIKLPGSVRASKRAELSFDIPGRLKLLNAKEGRKINKGEVIAQLDERDVKHKYHSAKANFKEAQSTFERYKDLIKENAIPKSSFDNAERNYDIALSDMNLAKKALDDTTLRAYFSGTIATRYVENFQNIQAKQAIVMIEDKSTLEVVVHVSEMEIAKIKQANIISMHASFAAITNEKVSLTIKEISEKIDEATRTYAVVFLMQANKKYNLLSGMTANVELQLKDMAQNEEQGMMLPVTAVTGGADDLSYAWVYSDGRVSKRAIEIGEMREDQILILSGLKSGEIVVIAGGNYLVDGMKVKPLSGELSTKLSTELNVALNKELSGKTGATQ